MDQVGGAVGQRRQAGTRIGRCEVHVIQRVKGLPPKFKISGFRKVELLREGRIQIPEPRRAELCNACVRGSELPGARVSRVVVRPEGLVTPERRLEGGRVNLLGNLLLAGAASVEMRVTDQVAPAG